MLKKIIGIKNVGRFKNSTGTPNPQLAKHTFIVGANGFGIGWICSESEFATVRRWKMETTS